MPPFAGVLPEVCYADKIPRYVFFSRVGFGPEQTFAGVCVEVSFAGPQPTLGAQSVLY